MKLASREVALSAITVTLTSLRGVVVAVCNGNEVHVTTGGCLSPISSFDFSETLIVIFIGLAL